jgi:hypothetical protein
MHNDKTAMMPDKITVLRFCWSIAMPWLAADAEFDPSYNTPVVTTPNTHHQPPTTDACC